MFEYIIGDLVGIKDEYLVIQSGYMGYRVYSSLKSMLDLEIGQKGVLLYTELVVREDDLTLYGFTSEEELNMFNLLLKVSRIGPKVAVGVLSSLSPNTIKKSILREDIVSLCKAPGIGKKTAERLILELKDKIDPLEIEELDGEEMIELEEDKNTEEAILALESLGYTRYELEKIVKDMDTGKLEVEEIIRLTLKELSN